MDEDDDDMTEHVVELFHAVSEVAVEEGEGAAEFEADAGVASSCVAQTVVCVDGLLALLVLASVPETFRPNDVRAWAMSNNSSPRALDGVVEALVISEWTAPVPALGTVAVAVAFPLVEPTGRLLEVELCAEAAIMMSEVNFLLLESRLRDTLFLVGWREGRCQE